MKIYKNSGDVITIVAAQTIASNDFVSIGKMKGFAQTDAEIGASVAIVTRGVFGAAVSAAADVAVGDEIYDAAGALTTDPTDAEYVGYAATAAVAQDGFATVDIRLA